VAGPGRLGRAPMASNSRPVGAGAATGGVEWLLWGVVGGALRDVGSGVGSSRLDLP
jgi:hypothetical protein